MATYRDAAVDLMKQLVLSGRGYYLGGGRDWSNVSTMYTYGVGVSMLNGATDCSGSVTNVYAALGVISKGYYETADMRSKLTAQGFLEHQWSDSYVMRPGDLALCEPGHVAMCVADDFTLAEFLPGAVRITPFYEPVMKDGRSWNYCLELPDSIGDRTWSGSGTSGSGTGGSGTVGGSIAEDGVWGKATTAAMQRHYGTVADGEVWHQWRPNIDANPVLGEGWMCDETLLGSTVIRALQSDLGVEADGIMGPATISAIYDLFGGAYGHSTTLSAAAVWEIQHQLNGGVWPLHL